MLPSVLVAYLKGSLNHVVPELVCQDVLDSKLTALFELVMLLGVVRLLVLSINMLSVDDLVENLVKLMSILTVLSVDLGKHPDHVLNQFGAILLNTKEVAFRLNEVQHGHLRPVMAIVKNRG